MSNGKHQKRRIRILVKAFPQASTKHEETVCCAGVTEDTRELLRLFPIRYRRLDNTNRFDRYDLVEMTITKASDPRPESYRVDEGSIRRLEPGNRLPDTQKVKLWQPFIAPSLTALMEDNKSTRRSLGIIKPDPGSLKFQVRPAGQSDEEDKKVAQLVFQQASLLEEPLKPLTAPELSFSYQYTSSGRRHRHQIHDWEVQATYVSYQRRYDTKDKALDMMRQEYQHNIPQRNLHFIMGTMLRHPQTFIVIGLLRSPLDPEELDRQGDLF